MPPTLTSFAVGDFQSYRDIQSVTIDERLTLVAGRNNVGKSALLRALRIPVEPQEGAGPNFSIAYTWEMSPEELLGLALRPGDSSPELHDWAHQHPSHVVRATFRRKPDADSSRPVSLSDLYVSEFELPNEGKHATGGAGGHPQWDRGEWGGGAYMEFFLRIPEIKQQVSFIAPRKIQQGPWALTQSTTLDPDARNLIEVVLYLQMNSPTRRFRDLTEFMVSAFPEIETLTVMEVGGQVQQGQLGVVYANLERPVPMQQCGTGVEQLLALAVGLLTAPEPRLFLIDEPQAYLHPHAERSLLRLLESHPQHQYVVATHSVYLLSARPLSSARLLALEDEETRITEFPTATDLLSELGITAADLWLAERVLWVEGRSEVEAIHAAVQDEMRDIKVRPMPEAAARFSSASARQAEATYRFCSDVVDAITPLPVKMLFLFDSDEKTPEHRQRIEEASQGRARFLSVRELENLFLDAELLELALVERAALIDRPAPTRETIQRWLDDHLELLDDRQLFPRPLAVGERPLDRVRGSEVLRRLYWDVMTSEFDKVSDGKRLAELAAQHKPDVLETLRAVVRELAEDQ